MQLKRRGAKATLTTIGLPPTSCGLRLARSHAPQTAFVVTYLQPSIPLLYKQSFMGMLSPLPPVLQAVAIVSIASFVLLLGLPPHNPRRTHRPGETIERQWYSTTAPLTHTKLLKSRIAQRGIRSRSTSETRLHSTQDQKLWDILLNCHFRKLFAKE